MCPGQFDVFSAVFHESGEEILFFGIRKRHLPSLFPPSRSQFEYLPEQVKSGREGPDYG